MGGYFSALSANMGAYDRGDMTLSVHERYALEFCGAFYSTCPGGASVYEGEIRTPCRVDRGCSLTRPSPDGPIDS